MSRVHIAPIVEGHGEVQAVPMLIRRIAAEVDPELTAVVEPPIRVPANRLRKPGELERTVELAARKLGGTGGILILIDCDWDRGCPKWDGPALLQRAQSARPDMKVQYAKDKT